MPSGSGNALAGNLLPDPHALRTMRPLLVRGGAVWQLVGLITRRSQVQILPPLPLSKNKRSNSAGCGRPATNSPVLRQHCPAPLAEPSARGHFPTRTAAQPGARCGAIKIMPQQLSWLNTPHRKDAGQFGQCLRTPKRHAVHWPARVPSVFEKFRCRDRQFTTRTRQHVRLVWSGEPSRLPGPG